MPLTFWWEAFSTAATLISGLPTPVLQGQSPMQLLFNKQLDVHTLRVFGCVCYPYLRPYQSHKFQFHSEKCVYFGPSPHHKVTSVSMPKVGYIYLEILSLMRMSSLMRLALSLCCLLPHLAHLTYLPLILFLCQHCHVHLLYCHLAYL